MLSRITIVILLIQYTTPLLAQDLSRISGKPPIDTAALFAWPTIPDWPSPAISNNGKYAMYSIRYGQTGGTTTMVQALNSNWKIGQPGVQQATFTNDSRRIIFMLQNDSLCLLMLSNAEKTYIPGVRSFEVFMRGGTEWLLCQMTNNDKELVLQNFATGRQNVYKNVDSYILSENKKTIVLQRRIPDTNGKEGTSIQWLNLLTSEVKEIWKGMGVNSILMDVDGKQLAFLVIDSNTAHKVIWTYKAGDLKAAELASDRSPVMVKDMEVDAIDGFSKDGRKLFIQLKRTPPPKPTSNITPVNMWSYTDAKLQSQQLDELKERRPSYLAVVDIQRHVSIRCIQQKNETITRSKTDSFALIISSKAEFAEYYWNKEAPGRTYLVTIKNGKRKPVPLINANISPEEKYIIGYGVDKTWSDLYVYDIATNITRNITANIPIPLKDEENDVPSLNKSRGLKFAGWLAKDTSLLVYDNYDIWQVDPSGKKAPVKLTNGRSKKTQFRHACEGLLSNGSIAQPTVLSLLTAFNKVTKQQGFYRLTRDTSGGPELLSLGDYVFGTFWDADYASPFVKARDTNIYLVKREQANQFPNIFATTDFKRFIPLSQTYPEKTINWLTSELIVFFTRDSIQTRAILYKPEGFNHKSKYPLIIHYYDKKSNALNQYRSPLENSGSELDIAWFVSHGYLVLLTDIHYAIGETGESVYKAIVDAATHLSKQPYVDKSHIGIHGHSFGGYETNYLVTHSDLFAAAVSSSGASDLASDYGNLWPDNAARQEYWEMRDGRLGTTPWENPDIYMQNSPIFFVNKVKAPILMVQNKRDKNVHFEQGLEFFTALRRAGKRAWMLQYDNGGHGVYGNEYKDYLLRLTQFFNHYLKGAPAPRWMTVGIPADMKGIDDGLQIDNKIKTPGDGLLTDYNKMPLFNKGNLRQTP